MSLTTCLKKAGAYLHSEDKSAILARAKELRSEGKSALAAATQAVVERIGAVQAMLDGRAPAAESVHKDPGKPAEPVTAAVVAKSLNTAAQAEGRKPSAMKAELLAMIDAAMEKAPKADESIVNPDALDKNELNRELQRLVREKKAANITEAAKVLRERWESKPKVEFDVPGDGKFKIVNTKESLAEFRQQVESAAGFKDKTPRKGMGRAVSSPDLGPQDLAREMLDDGEPVNALELLDSIDKPMMFGNASEGRPIPYTHGEMLEMAGSKFFVGRGWSTKKGNTSWWAVVHEPSGLSIASGTTKAAALADAKKKMADPKNLERMKTLEAEGKSADGQAFKTQAELRKEFDTWAQQHQDATFAAADAAIERAKREQQQEQQRAALYAEVMGKDAVMPKGTVASEWSPGGITAFLDAAKSKGKADEALKLLDDVLPSSNTYLRQPMEKWEREYRKALEPMDTGWQRGFVAPGGARRIRRDVSLPDGRQFRVELDERAGRYITGTVQESTKDTAGWRTVRTFNNDENARQLADEYLDAWYQTGKPRAKDGFTITRDQESDLYRYMQSQLEGQPLRYEMIAKRIQRVADGVGSSEDAQTAKDWLQAMQADGEARVSEAAASKARAESEAAEGERRAAEKSAESLAKLRAGQAENPRYQAFLDTQEQAELDKRESVTAFNVDFMAFINARSGEFKKANGITGEMPQDAFGAYVRQWADEHLSERVKATRSAPTLKDRVEAQRKAAAPAAPASRFEGFKATMNAIYDGKATVEQYRASFNELVANEADVRAELNKLTKDDLIRTFGIMARPSEAKASLVDTAYNSMLRGFALGKEYGPNSYMMTRGGYENYLQQKAAALAELVNSQTAEDLTAYAAQVKRERDELAAKRKAVVEAIQDPKTLEDYRRFAEYHMRDGKSLREARMLLTPEQRASFDNMMAEASRSQRKDRRDESRDVRPAGQTVDGQIVATKHTRDGYDLFVVRLAERVSTEDYRTLLASAKKLGGWYSSFRGNGAIAGFQFKDKPSAEAFLQLAGGDKTAASEAAAARRDAFEDDRSQTAVERLNEMADRLEDRADENLSRERKANTERRARMAASAEADARSDKALAKTMRNIARALENGSAKFLDRVRQKVQVEMLRRMVKSAKDDELRSRYPSYADFEKHQGEAPTADTAEFVEFPNFTAYRSDLAALARRLQDVDGMKLIAQKLMKVADDVTDAFTQWAKEPGNLYRLSTFSTSTGNRPAFKTEGEAERAIARSGYRGRAIPWNVKRGEWTIIMSPAEAMQRGIWKGDGDKRITLTGEFGLELVEKASRRGKVKDSVPWQFETAADRRKALARMGIETPAELRAAVREFIGLQEMPEAEDKVKKLERAMVGRRNDGFDFFPTPASVATEMVDTADIQPGMRVLEPSAGMGHIAEAIREAGVEPDVVEIASDRRELLEAKGFNVVGRDFLTVTEGGYDRILMNPPFSDGRDIEHIRHAYSLLKPGGRIVAIVGEGAFSQSFKRAEEFRQWVDSLDGSVEKLAEGTFMDPSLPVNTSANARLVVIDKPESDRTSLSIDPEEGTPLFYSVMARQVEASTMNAAPAVGWKTFILGLRQKGVKPDEIEWSGVLDWLDMQKGKVTKQAVLDFLNANGVKVTETVLRNAENRVLEPDEIEADLLSEYQGKTDDWLRQRYETVLEQRPPEDMSRADLIAGIVEVELDYFRGNPQDYTESEQRGGATRYMQYTLPGGTNYREVLLTLPLQQDPELRAAGERLRAAEAAERAARDAGEDVTKTRGDLTDATDQARAAFERAREAQKQRLYRSGHWDQPNILAHIRLNDRTDADGKRVLFVEEIQSDWAQAGKKEGFIGRMIPQSTEWMTVDTLDTFPTREEAEAWAAANPNPRPGENTESRLIVTGANGRGFTVYEQQRSTVAEAPAKSGLPRAPFVDSTDKWVALALKRVIAMAAQEGYDRVAFVTGEQSAERYDLSKQISEVHFEDNNTGGIGEANLDGPPKHGLLYANDLNGKRVMQQYIAPENIEDYVGKEVARKLLEQKPKRVREAGIGFRRRSLSGLDLKVGGEGMRAFYDKIVPSVAKDVLRKVGGGQLGTVELPAKPRDAGNGWGSTGEDVTGHPATTQPGFDITTEMREKARSGLPLFAVDAQSGGADTGSREPASAADIAAVQALQSSLRRDYPDLVLDARAAPVRAAGGQLPSMADRDVAAAIEIARRFFDKRVVLFESEKPFANGVHSTRQPGVIFLNAKATRPSMAIVGHEMLHAMRFDRPDLYDTLAARLATVLRDPGLHDQLLNMKRRAKGWADLGADTLREELIADIVGDNFTDPEFWKLMAKEQPTGFRAVVDSILRFLDDLIGMVTKGSRPFGTEQFLTDIQAARAAVADAMRNYSGGEVGAVTAPTEGVNLSMWDDQPAADDVKLSIMDGTLRSFNQQGIRDRLADIFGSGGAKVSWWDKTLGTQYAKAQKHPAFRKVFDRVQGYLEDTSSLANEAADEAPEILPKLETWKDLKHSGLSDADAKALSGPIFEGTLIEKRVFEPWELKERYGLSDQQVGLYRQFLNTVNTSLDQLVAAEVLRLLGDTPVDFRAMAMGDRAGMRRAIGRFLDQQIELAEGNKENQARLMKLRADINDKYDRIDRLKAEGYAPLMRFGKYAVNVTDPQTGESLFFGLYESKAEANRMARELAEDDQFKDMPIDQGVLSSEQYKLFSAVPVESLELFADAIGADQSAVFQEYLRLAKNNRSALKRLIHRKGTAGFSKDVDRVLASFVTSNSRLAAGTMNLPQAKDAVMAIRDGDVKDEAVKLLESVENPTDTASGVRSLMFMNFIGGSVASALVNMTQPITMTLPFLSQWGGLARAGSRLMAAGKMAASGKVDDAGLRAALQRAEDDGIVSPQEIHHLQAQAMAAWGTNVVAKRLAFIWSAPFSLAEQFNRRVSFIAAYQTAVEEKLDDPFGFAERAVIETQGLYNRGNVPNLARTGLGAAALTFKQFSIHYLEWLGRMYRSGPSGKRAVLYALAILMAAGGTDGLPFADDLDDLIDTLMQSLGIDMPSKVAKRKFVADTLGLGDEAADVVARGLSALPGMPLDVSLRMGMGNLIPATGILLPSNTDRSKDVLELAGPAGSLAKQYIDAGQQVLRGEYDNAVMAAVPVALQNVMKAAQVWSTGEYRDQKDAKVADADVVDGFMKFLGFQPQSIARESQKMGMLRRSEQLAKNVEGEIASQWARGIADGDQDAVANARQRLADWNDANPDSRISITSAQVLQRVRKLREDRSQRFLSTVSPERRARVAEEMQQ